MPSRGAVGARHRHRSKQRHGAVRADIQGLRALAVLTVFADHLFGWPSGGFIGVDVFFVISGFLITGILVREFESTGHISFGGFYARRARRILPAAIATIVVTVALSYVLFPASKARGVLWDGIASFFFVGNWRFAATGTDYFAQGAPSPLQHFWSLSVEEQFYFVWPWLMLGILLVGVRVVKGSVRAALTVAGGLMVAVVIASFVFAIFQSAAEPTVAYFSTLTRVWELGVGAVLAIFGSALLRMPMWLRISMAWTGLAVIGFALFTISPESLFPAPWAALPVLGSALVLAAGIGQEPRGNVLLTNPVSRYIGDVSYSLYLWHWPVIILGGTMFPEPTVWYYLGASVVGIILAVISYELIERPMTASPMFKPLRPGQRSSEVWRTWRQSQADRVRFVTIAVLLPTIAGCMALVYIFPPGNLSAEQIAHIQQLEAQRNSERQNKQDGIQVPVYEPTGELNRGIYEALSVISWPDTLTPTIDTVEVEGRPDEDFLSCDRPDSETCIFGPEGAPTMLVYGDSLGTTLLPTLRAAYEQEYRIRALTRAACAVTNLDVTWRSDQERDGCAQAREAIRGLVATTQPEIVFVIQSYGWADRLVSQATGDAAAAEWSSADTALEAELKSLGAQQVVFISSPPQGKSIIDCATGGSTPASCTTQVPSYWPVILKAQQSMTANLIDQGDWFCAEGRCPPINGGLIVRRDHVHPTKQYAAQMAGEFRERMDAIMQQW